MDDPFASVSTDSVALENSTTDDLSLPRATLLKIISSALPANIVCSKETQELFMECCIEFIHLIASEASEICSKEERKTITPDHIAKALSALGFAEYCIEVEATATAQKECAKKEKKTVKTSNLTLEQLQAQQAELFEKARLKMAQERDNGAQKEE